MTTLRELEETPDELFGARVEVTGYVNDLLYEAPGLTDKENAVRANWSHLNIDRCRGKVVVAQGVLRKAPEGMRFRAILDVESMREP